MTRALSVSLALVLVWAAHPSSVRQTSPPTVAPSLVSTWTLTTFEHGVSGGPAARVPNPRGLLVLDAAGHAFEFVTSSATQRIAGGQVPVADAPAAFGAYGGFWGQYRVDQAQKTITYRAESGVHPQIGGKEFSRSFSLEENRLTITSAAEPYTPSGHEMGLGSRPVDRQSLPTLSPRRRLLAARRRETREPDDGHDRIRNEAVTERDRLHARGFCRGAFSAAQSQAVRCGDDRRLKRRSPRCADTSGTTAR